MRRECRPRRRIAVIGGSGFVGTVLVEQLLACGHQVTILDRQRSNTFPHLWAAADVRKRKQLTNALSGADLIYNLAAEHRDDVRPRQRYWDVNVDGARNVCHAAEKNGIKSVVFTSSVAVYGLQQAVPNESSALQPFNDYGHSKVEAESVHRQWLQKSSDHSLSIVRPTVIFGEGNRGNVYNLMRQIASCRFAMVGQGTNRKSLAYVRNVAAFLEFALRFGEGEHLYNYVDTPDMDMNTLVTTIRTHLALSSERIPRVPFVAAVAAAIACDTAARVSGKKFSLSVVRLKKFCADTVFCANKLRDQGFEPRHSLSEALQRTLASEFGSHPATRSLRNAA